MKDLSDVVRDIVSKYDPTKYKGFISENYATKLGKRYPKDFMLNGEIRNTWSSNEVISRLNIPTWTEDRVPGVCGWQLSGSKLL